MPSGGIEKSEQNLLLLKRARLSKTLFFRIKHFKVMKTVRIFAYGIALVSVILSSLNQQNRGRTVAKTTVEGTLVFVANGEDFVRQGFVSKDGWNINFEHLYVNISDAIAYSTESSFEPQKGDSKESINYQNRINFDLPQTPDLAEGEANAEPIVVASAKATEGFYNALAWKLSPGAADSLIPGNTMQLMGQATKDGEVIDFDLGFNQPTEYICGEYIGEERQGIVTENTSGVVEATFHFDHIFGDGDTPLEDAINQDALGFQPLANLALNGIVKLNEADLASQLSPPDYQQLTEQITSLGHVGEGHCVVTNSQ